MAGWSLEISEEETTQPLGTLYHCLVNHTAQNCCLEAEPPLFQFVLIAFSPGAGHHWKETDSIFSSLSLQVFVDFDEIP